MKQLRIKVDLLVDYLGGDPNYEAAETVNRVNDALSSVGMDDQPQIVWLHGRVAVEKSSEEEEGESSGGKKPASRKRSRKVPPGLGGVR